MKIILKESIYNLGELGDIVTVAGGYARNYLIPRGMAMEATKGNLNQFEAEKEALMKKLAHLKSEAEKVAAKLGEVTLEYTRKSSAEQKLFGSVTSQELADGLKEKDFDIEKRAILLPSPIKTVGETKVKVKLDQGVLAEITVNVIAEIDENAAPAEPVIEESAEETSTDAEAAADTEAPAEETAEAEAVAEVSADSEETATEEKTEE